MKFFDQPQKDTEAIDKIMNQNSISSETEKQSLEEDGFYDLSEAAFKEINPMGLLLADVKRNLEKETGELEAQAEEYKLMGKDEETIGDLYDQAIEKHKWIIKIDSYLSKDNEIITEFKPNQDEELTSHLN